MCSKLNPNILKSFKCNACGGCCRWDGSVLLTNSDIKKFATYLHLTEEEFIDKHTRLAPNRNQLALLDKPNGNCVWLKNNRCSVYEIRPEQCRNFPFTWSVSKGCPALDKLTVSEKNIAQPEGNP